MKKHLILPWIVFLSFLAIGCITDGTKPALNEDKDISQLYETFNAPHSLNISSLTVENDITKIVYVNMDRETVIFTIEPVTPDSTPLQVNTRISDVDAYYRDLNGLYTYVWIQDDFKFSIVGTDEIMVNDFVYEFMLYLKT